MTYYAFPYILLQMVFLLLNMTKHKSNPCESNAQASDCFQCRVADSIFSFMFALSVAGRVAGREWTQNAGLSIQM